jgi:hypothetical protein
MDNLWVQTHANHSDTLSYLHLDGHACAGANEFHQLQKNHLRVSLDMNDSSLAKLSKLYMTIAHLPVLPCALL